MTDMLMHPTKSGVAWRPRRAANGSCPPFQRAAFVAEGGARPGSGRHAGRFSAGTWAHGGPCPSGFPAGQLRLPLWPPSGRRREVKVVCPFATSHKPAARYSAALRDAHLPHVLTFRNVPHAADPFNL